MGKMAAEGDEAKRLDEFLRRQSETGATTPARRIVQHVETAGHRRREGFRPLMDRKRTELQKLIDSFLSDEKGYVRLPTGETYYAAQLPSKRYDMSGRQLRFNLMGKARPARAKALAEKTMLDKAFATKIEDALLGERSIASLRLPRGTEEPAKGMGRMIFQSGKPFDMPVKDILIKHLKGGHAADPAQLIKDVGFRQPSNVEHILRKVYTRKGTYKMMRQSGFSKLRSLKAAILPKDRRLALGLGIAAAIAGGGIGAAKLMGKKKETAA